MGFLVGCFKQIYPVVVFRVCARVSQPWLLLKRAQVSSLLIFTSAVVHIVQMLVGFDYSARAVAGGPKGRKMRPKAGVGFLGRGS